MTVIGLMSSMDENRPADTEDGGGVDVDKQKPVGDIESESGMSIPKVRVELATPTPATPLPASPRDKKSVPVDNNNNQDDDDDEDDDDEDDDDEDVDAEEGEEEEEEEKEMTPEEKKEMHDAVQMGDIDALEDCLDKPNSDINMLWFRENLLMTAIREGHQEMAEFLLDNGVDHTFTTSVMGFRDTPEGRVLEQYHINCRQMAFDRDMLDIVELIDILQHNIFPFYKPQPRTPRLRRPKPVTPPPESETSQTGAGSALDEEGEGGDSSGGSQSDTEGSDSDQGGLSGVRTKTSNSHKKKKKKSRRSTITDEVDAAVDDEDKTASAGSALGEKCEVDSGHHSLGSSKLKVALVREHDKLSEREENGHSNGSVASPRRSNKSTEGDKSADHTAKEGEEEATEVHDEGYGSISMKSATPCLSPDLKPIWAPPEPSNRFRATKAALAIRKVNGYRNTNMHCMPPTQSYQDKPLKWKKVTSYGSYANESKHWRPITADTPDSSTDTRSSCSQDGLSLQMQELSTSTTPSSASVLGARSRSSIVSISSLTSASSNLTKSTSSSSAISLAKSGTSSVARYMQPTKSTITKQRLTPNFAPSYGVLDFTHVVRSQNGVPTDTSMIHRCSQKVPRVSTASKVLQRRAQQSFSFRR